MTESVRVKKVTRHQAMDPAKGGFTRYEVGGTVALSVMDDGGLIICEGLNCHNYTEEQGADIFRLFKAALKSAEARAMPEEEKLDPMLKLAREAIAQGGEVTITLRGKRPEDDVDDEDE